MLYSRWSSLAVEIALHSPIIASHNNFEEPMLILLMGIDACRIDFQPTLNFKRKISVNHFNYFPGKLMWAIISFCATFVLKLKFNMLIRSLHEDYEENPISRTHVNSTLIKKTSVVHVNCFHTNFPSTRIGLYSVAFGTQTCRPTQHSHHAYYGQTLISTRGVEMWRFQYIRESILVRELPLVEQLHNNGLQVTNNLDALLLLAVASYEAPRIWPVVAGHHRSHGGHPPVSGGRRVAYICPKKYACPLLADAREPCRVVLLIREAVVAPSALQIDLHEQVRERGAHSWSSACTHVTKGGGFKTYAEGIIRWICCWSDTYNMCLVVWLREDHRSQLYCEDACSKRDGTVSSGFVNYSTLNSEHDLRIYVLHTVKDRQTCTFNNHN